MTTIDENEIAHQISTLVGCMVVDVRAIILDRYDCTQQDVMDFLENSHKQKIYNDIEKIAVDIRVCLVQLVDELKKVKNES